MKQYFKSLYKKSKPYLLGGLDWLFPKYCFGCNTKNDSISASILCESCWEQLYKPQRIIFPKRPNCHIFSAGVYENLLKKSLILGKFKHDQLSIELLNEVFLKTFTNIPFPIDIMTSVPSYYFRTIYRGIDLPGSLAFELSKKTGIPYQPNLLRKTKWTTRQKNLDQEKRKKNVKKLFIANPEVKNKSILIIDDIMTTGSTILSCYTALKKQKPSRITFLTGAKTRY